MGESNRVTAESLGKTGTRSESLRQFLVLAKPRIALMVLLTVAVAGLISSSGLIDTSRMLHAMIGLLLVTASGCALNQYLERYVDWLMPRTAKRPLPDQKLSAVQVASFGAVSFGVGIAYLWTLVNWQAAALAATTWVVYVWLYTPLKARSWLNTYVGAVAGAMPVLVGSAAVSDGSVTWPAWLLFTVLYIWQFPHFMAIAWLYREDYRLANLQMVTSGDAAARRTGWHAIVFSVLLIPVTLLALWPEQWWGAGLSVIGGIFGLWYVLASARFARRPNDFTARRLFRVSLLYLPVYLVLLSISARFLGSG